MIKQTSKPVTCLLPYVYVLLFFFIDGFQYFSYMTYQIPLLIIVYCAIDSAVSYILRFYIALLIGAASVYTHGIFGAQLIPLAMVTGFAYVMHHFMYKKWVIPYCNFILFILIDYCIQQYFWHMPSYIEIGAMHIVVWVFVIGMLTRNKHIIPA